MLWFNLIAGLYLFTLFGCIVKITKGSIWAGSIIFKVAPGVIGLVLLYQAAKGFGF